MRQCSQCKKRKPATSEYFSPNKACCGGLRTACRECVNESNSARRKTPEGKAVQKKYWQSKKGKATRRKYFRSEKGKARNQWNKYGLTPTKRLKMYVGQNSCCKLCGKAVPYDKICTDHDHTTNKVRGLLCCSCNMGIGHLGDTIEGIEKALRYLKGGLG